MAHKTRVGGTNYDISGGRCQVAGTDYSIQKGRTLIGGAGYDVIFGKSIGDLAIGSSVWLNVDGVATEFLIVHKGNPDSSIYDSSCDGVWLLSKDVLCNDAWDNGTSGKYYGSSTVDIRVWMDETFFLSLDSNIQGVVKTVKIPYVKTSTTICVGSDGLSVQVFPLSAIEVGFTESDIDFDIFPEDGACLSYFASGGSRVAKFNGADYSWCLRTTSMTDEYYDSGLPFFVDEDDFLDAMSAYIAQGYRPALILPSDICVDANFNIIAQ